MGKTRKQVGLVNLHHSYDHVTLLNKAYKGTDEPALGKTVDLFKDPVCSKIEILFLGPM